MARTKAEEKQTAEGAKSPKKKNSTEKKSRREQIPITENEIQPNNRHCLRGLDGKYGRWDEILRDILNGKLKIVQNRKKTETDKEEEDDEDDEEMPETTERETYDTSERNGSYVPIRTNPEDNALQLHTDGEIPGTSWNRHKGTPKPDIIQKPADFIPSDPERTPDAPRTISASKTLFD